MGNSAAAIIGSTWKTTKAVKLAVSAVAAPTPAALVAGNAVLISDIDCYVLVGVTPVVGILTNTYHIFLPAGMVWPIVFDGLDKVSAITSAGSGNLHICYPQ